MVPLIVFFGTFDPEKPVAAGLFGHAEIINIFKEIRRNPTVQCADNRTTLVAALTTAFYGTPVSARASLARGRL